MCYCLSVWQWLYFKLPVNENSSIEDRWFLHVTGSNEKLNSVWFYIQYSMSLFFEYLKKRYHTLHCPIHVLCCIDFTVGCKQHSLFFSASASSGLLPQLEISKTCRLFYLQTGKIINLKDLKKNYWIALNFNSNITF
jgi:hypothetical protein